MRERPRSGPDGRPRGPELLGGGVTLEAITVTGDVPRRITLVMLSGGIDSVWTLYRLLKDTDDEIFAHHIHFVNEEGRHEAEAAAARAVAGWLRKHVRAFHYSETGIDHRNMRWFGFDIMGVGFEAGICARSLLLARKRPMDRWTIGTCAEEGHDAERFVHVEAVMAANCYPDPAPPFFLLPPVPKAQEVAELGPDLAALCWTCRRPKRKPEGGFAECGKCKTCKLMAEIRSAGAPAGG